MKRHKSVSDKFTIFIWGVKGLFPKQKRLSLTMRTYCISLKPCIGWEVKLNPEIMRSRVTE